jgi:hypothetical protein
MLQDIIKLLQPAVAILAPIPFKKTGLEMVPASPCYLLYIRGIYSSLRMKT